jgi:hypothetical protein
MTTPQKAIAYAVLAIALVLGTAWGIKHRAASKGSKDEAQAQVFKGEANATQTTAQASDAKIPDLQAKVDDQAASLVRLQAERDALLRKLAAKVPSVSSNPDPTGAVSTPDSVSDVRDEVIAKDAEVITAQTKQIQDQQAVIVALTGSRDQWKATADLRDKQAMAQEAATAAWKQAVVASRWQGRIEGFAAGAVLGYLGGKR